ncbi:hypothetical protein J2Y69_001424 [Microbacterium resistens]|uniref:DUF11 domain-containing protein n=1 Tax=Microbacterium resistens TaxID=156977 RepID=A0ABU1SB51_9MICO|nr:hypothetical protein [Microbacterium resistens]MDR6866825.1 hypothetical protein [Microbacterium resistens]
MMKDSNVNRRTVLKGTAWSVPIIIASTAVPHSAASTVSVDLTAVARLPNEPRNGTHDGYPYWQGPRVLSFTMTYTNNGPDALPPGGTITFGLPFAVIWGDATIISDPSGLSPVFIGTGSEQISDSPLAYRKVYSYAVPVSIAAGMSFSITFQVPLNDTSNTATNSLSARTTASFSVGTSGATDIDPSNNTGYSNRYALFNNVNAG